MTKGQIFAKYKHLSPEDQRTFDRWLRANAIVGSLLWAGLLAIALSGPHIQETASTPTSAQGFSFQELHGLAHLDNLPVDHIHDQALVFAAPESETRSTMLTEGKAAAAD
jgi:hypothetical protein